MAKNITNKTGSSLTLVIPPWLGGNIKLPPGVSSITDEVADWLRAAEHVYGQPVAEVFEIEP